MNETKENPGTEEAEKENETETEARTDAGGKKLEGKAAEDPETQAQSDGSFLQSNPPQDGRAHGDGNVHQNSPRENTAEEDRTGEEPTKGDIAAAAAQAEGRPASEVEAAKKAGDDADTAAEDDDSEDDGEKADR